jgi:hypothetical protein
VDKRILTFVVATNLLVGLGSAAASQPPPTDARFTACYKLTLSPWTPDLNLGEDAVFVTPPTTIELTGTAERGGFLVKPALGAAQSIHSTAYWRPLPKAQIRIVWTTGFSGLTMILKREDSSLVGTAETFWDFARRIQKAKVRADEVPCDASGQ